MEQIRIKMLPIEQWQEARIIKFRYTHLDQSCNATIVYYLPLNVNGDNHDNNQICDCLVEALKNMFGEIHVWKKVVAFDNIKSEMQKVYDGGRPKVHLVVRMIPEIPVADYPKFYGKDIYAYDYHLNIQLDYLGNLDKYNKDLQITVPFQLGQEANIAWGMESVETL